MKYLPHIVFGVCFAALIFLYGYPGILQYGPISVHSWRQADGASLSLSYYNNGMHFFEPGVHNLVAGNGKTVAEFPIIYYIGAIFYALFGDHHVWLRLLNSLLFFAGLYALYRVLHGVLGDLWGALAVALAMMSSFLLAFYGFNYLPNTAGLGLTWLGAWSYYRYYQTGRLSWFYGMGGIVLIAGLIKVSVLSPFLALIGAGVCCQLWPAARSRYRRWFPPFWHMAIVSAVILGTVAAWYLWASHYNRVNGSGLFLTGISESFFSLPKAGVDNIVKEIAREYHKLYFSTELIYLLVALMVLILLMPRRVPLPVYLTFLFTLLGSTAFILLFFGQILIHHYYIIDILFLPALTLGIALWLAKQYLPRWYGRFLPQLIVLGFAGWGIYQTQARMHYYYSAASPDYTAVNPSLLKQDELHQFLNERDIRFNNSLVVCVPDYSPNMNLYYLNLKGWTVTPAREWTTQNMDDFRKWGASHIIVTDSTWLKHPFLEGAKENPLGVFDNSIYVYKVNSEQ